MQTPDGLPRGHCETKERAEKDGVWPRISLSPMHVRECDTVEADVSLGHFSVVDRATSA